MNFALKFGYWQYSTKHVFCSSSSSSSSMFISSTIVQTLQKQNMIYNNK